jgi:transposase
MIRVAVVVTMPASTASAANDSESEQRRGDVLSMVRELHAAGDTATLLDIVAHLVREVEQLKRELAEKLLRRKKGEGVSSAQLKLLLEALSPEQDAQAQQANEALGELTAAAGTEGGPDTERKPRPRPVRRPLPPDLRRVDNPIAVPEAERPCPVCGTDRACIGHDVSHVIDIIPAEVIVRVDRREKLACPTCEGELVRAPAGDKVVAGGTLGAKLVAQVLVDKYRDGLPLHRQKQRLERLGLSLPVSTLADQITWSTDLLRPLWRAVAVQVVGSAVMQLDGTGIAVRDPRDANKKKLGSLWGYLGGLVAVYLYASTGKKLGQKPGELGPEDMLALRSGYTVADASNLFEHSFARDELIECGCNMHARRYFKKALDAGDTRACLVLGAFKKLYEIEARIKDDPPDDKLKIRQSESAPVYDKLTAWCRAHQALEPPKSATGVAIRYMINHEQALRRFLEHPAIPIDNGAVERLHVRVALTRKNFLFAGSDAGAERAAIAYTLLACCDLAGVDPVAYLADVLPRLARRIRLADVPDLLPLAWKASRPKNA